MNSSEDMAVERQSKSSRAQMHKGIVEMALLSLLRTEPQYGLKILDLLRNAAGLPIAEGTLYPLLYRLEKQSWIKAEWRLEDEASHPRKYYLLTKEGRTELAVQLRDWYAMTRKLSSFLKRGDV